MPRKKPSAANCIATPVTAMPYDAIPRDAFMHFMQNGIRISAGYCGTGIKRCCDSGASFG
jgi:hypothetical protein